MNVIDPPHPPVLPDEQGRLAALRALQVLDTPAEPGLDVITQLAADRFDCPIALVSLVDVDRQWFKARTGLDACETDRRHSFCAHAIASSAVMVVPDATADPRFARNPLVTGAPHIRFYAAAPLVAASGHRIGTLCVIGDRPRDGLSPREAHALTLMAGQVMEYLEQRRLRQSVQISQLIGETTSDAFVCTDAHSRIIHWNRGAEALFGWSEGEALGQSLDLIIPDRHRHGHHSGMARLRARGPTKMVGTTVEVPANTRAGHEVPIELSLGMWPAEGEGDPEGFAAIIRDVSARKAAEAERAATEARLAQQVAAIEASNDGIAITDPQGRFIFMNEAHATMFGHDSPASLIGQPWSVLYDEAEARRIGKEAMPVVASAGQWRGETMGVSRSGQPVPQEVSLSLSSDGGIVCVTRDIGQRQAMEREKARLREQLMLAQRQEAVGQLAGGIAHDFNNLIAAIAGTAGLMERHGDGEVRHHALRIQAATATATGLVEKLLALGRRAPERRQVDLRATLFSVRDLVSAGLADRQHRIEMSVPSAPMWALADPTEMMQVVMNLAINARDALPPGQPGRILLSLALADGAQPQGDVVLGRRPAGPAALIGVSDDGTGIAQGHLPQVFEPFFTDKGRAGTGLGLSVVAGIITGLGGALSLTSRPGLGTRFQIWWPLETEDQAAPGHAIAMVADADVLTGRAVLVVDDNPAVVDTLVAMLEQAGAEAGPCLDPADAIAAVEEDPGAWDLVISDYDMPGLNGAELAVRLRQHRPDLPILLLTALPRLLDRRPQDAALFDAVVGKPASFHDLVAAARVAMAAAAQRPS